MTAIVVLVGLLLGALLRLRFRAFVLVPATITIAVCTVVAGATRGHTIGQIAGAAVLSAVALQAGYIAHAIRLSARRQRDALHGSTFAPIP